MLARVNGEARAHCDVARMLRHVDRPAEARQHALAALEKDPKLERARDLLNELDGKGAAAPAIQTVEHTVPVPETQPPPAPPSGKSKPAAQAQPDSPTLPKVVTAGVNDVSTPPGPPGSKEQPISTEEGMPIRIPPLPSTSVRSVDIGE
jgi:hypothetical protein